jgi:hypothetical protein
MFIRYARCSCEAISNSLIADSLEYFSWNNIYLFSESFHIIFSYISVELKSLCWRLSLAHTHSVDIRTMVAQIGYVCGFWYTVEILRYDCYTCRVDICYNTALYGIWWIIRRYYMITATALTKTEFIELYSLYMTAPPDVTQRLWQLLTI